MKKRKLAAVNSSADDFFKRRCARDGVYSVDWNRELTLPTRLRVSVTPCNVGLAMSVQWLHPPPFPARFRNLPDVVNAIINEYLSDKTDVTVHLAPLEDYPFCALTWSVHKVTTERTRVKACVRTHIGMQNRMYTGPDWCPCIDPRMAIVEIMPRLLACFKA